MAKPPPVPPVTRSLPCALTEKELTVRRDLLAAKELAAEECEGRRQAFNEQNTGEKKTIKADIRRIAREIRTKEELRPIAVRTDRHENQKRITVTRLDTNIVIEEREMRADELQQPLALDSQGFEDAPKGKGKRGKKGTRDAGDQL